MYERDELGISWRNWGKRRLNLKLWRARIRARISVRERKRRTRRLILMGSYLEHVTQNDPGLARPVSRKNSMASWNGTAIGNYSICPQTKESHDVFVV